jgi:SET domain-containing protein
MADVEVKLSPIEGLGIFAVRTFEAGERIKRVSVVREVTPEAPIRQELGERLDHCSYPDGKIVLWDFPDRHVNHSCDPNAYEQFDGATSYFVARRIIPVGEEITFDYNINIANGTAWPCCCGALRCLHQVMGDFFLLPLPWQREYRPLLADWFQRQHTARIASLDRMS